MKISRFVAEIDRAIKADKLYEPFRASDVRAACPSFADKTYNTFLPKHRRDNPQGYKEYFERIELGLYKRLRN